jgi:hypothetical protein
VPLLVVEIAMDRPVIQPSKEQVRAYMAARGNASRPPPAPADIRRQLGWKLAPPQPTAALISLCLLPATTGQFISQLVLDWCLMPLRPLRPSLSVSAPPHPTRQP